MWKLKQKSLWIKIRNKNFTENLGSIKNKRTQRKDSRYPSKKLVKTDNIGKETCTYWEKGDKFHNRVDIE